MDAKYKVAYNKSNLNVTEVGGGGVNFGGWQSFHKNDNSEYSYW